MSKINFTNATQKGAKNTVSDVWLTPPEIIDKLGVFDLDPCGWIPQGEPIVKTALNYFDVEINGLDKDWNYPFVFVNFPYSEAKIWMEKVVSEYKKWNNNIVVLCFNRSDTRWFQANAKYATGINCISKRISFLDSNGNKKSNGNAPSILIAYGEEAYERCKNIQGTLLRIDK
jgi:hypothetical protein